MKNATLLVALGTTAEPVDLQQLSESAHECNLHLLVLILGAMPPIPVYTYGIGEYGAYALPYGWQADVDRANAELEDLRTSISKYLADQGASAEVRVASGEAAYLPNALAHAALTCDAILLGDDLRDNGQLFGDVVRAALFRAPAGVMVNWMKSTAAIQPKSVFLAWKAGIPSSRAVHAALPMLRSAEEVTVALIDPVTTRHRDGDNPGSDVAAWLNHQGCKVTVQQYPSGGEEIGTVMLKRAKETGADMIVMGAYDHSRLREVVFGGTTRMLIEQRDCPVFLCH
jgi:nucleotide-binding universal stress UspA family protein